jgi:hypothetical protein
MRVEIQRIIVEAINTALERQRVPRPDHLAMVLQLARRAFADQLNYLLAVRDKLTSAQFATLYDATNMQANEDAINAIAQIVEG